MGIAGDILGLGRRMSIRNAFIASIALVLGIAWLGEASAQSSLPPCPPIGYAWDGCVGTYTWGDGRKYVGEYRDGQPNGRGTITWPDGVNYVGEWRAGKSNGKGTMTYPDGQKYVGEWSAGKSKGKGTKTYPDGSQYVGDFNDDRFDGRGTFTWPDGQTYVGEYRDGKQNGQGTMTLPGGGKYVGGWNDDAYSGRGTFTWPDGRKYVGYFLNSQRNGQGTFTLSSGAKYIGAWQADQMHGYGKEYSSNGELVREGYWVSNAYSGPNAPDSLRVENSGRVKMVESGGIYHIPVVINDTLKLDFIVDSGASDVSIPSDVVLTLIRTGTIKRSDFIGTEKYRLADGSAVESGIFTIRSLKVGDRTVTNVRASIADVNGPLLLGQSFLSKFKSWSQDNVSHELVLQ
jgi:hypothetical protein